MAANQTNVHKRMDKILQKLNTLENNDKALAKQTNYLAQLVVLAKQDSARPTSGITGHAARNEAGLRPPAPGVPGHAA